MIVIKCVLLILIVALSSYIGLLLGQRYVMRVKELKEVKMAFSIFLSKIKFTYEALPQVFREIATSIKGNIGKVFQRASQNMEEQTAGTAWERALEETKTNLLPEDVEILRGLSPLLGKVDLEGQAREITLVDTFLNTQLEKAEEICKKNNKLYKNLRHNSGNCNCYYYDIGRKE